MKSEAANKTRIKNAVAFVEIPVWKFERALTFYNKIFDTSMDVIEKHSPSRRFSALPCSASGVNVAIADIPGFEPGPGGARVYLDAGENLSEILDRIETAGGKLALAKTKLQEHCYYALFFDTEGNQVGLYSPK